LQSGLISEPRGSVARRLPVLIDTWKSPAWRAMSHGAKVLYVSLKARYNFVHHNNGRIYLSQRTAAAEIGSRFGQIARWFRELQHFGFIVQTKGGSLGLNGKGTAPHWRLTECGYMNDPPTRDFLRWNGQTFTDVKRRTWQKRKNPVAESCNTLLQKAATPPLQECATLRGPTVAGICNMEVPTPVAGMCNISSLPLPPAGKRKPRATPRARHIVQNAAIPPKRRAGQRPLSG
jgi:hypothetical protein